MSSLCQASKRLRQIINPSLYKAAIKTPHFLSATARDGKLDTLKVAASFGADLNRVYWVPAPSWSLLCWNGVGSNCAASEDPDSSGSDDSDYGNFEKPIFSRLGFAPIHVPLKDPALPNDRDIGYCWATPLHLAAAEGHYDMAEWLLSQGVDLDVPGKMLCSCSSFSEILAEGGDRSILQSGTWTPLHYAICRSHPKVALFLIDNGASLEVRYPWSKDIPRTHGIEKLFGLGSCQSASEIRRNLGGLLTYHLGVKPHSGGKGFGRKKKELLSEQYQRRCLQYNMSAIHCAAFSNEPEVLRHLVDLGISVDTADGCGANILYHAVESRSLEMVRYALSLQTNLSASVYIVNRRHPIKHRVEGICQWVARFCHYNSSPNYLDAVIVMLAEHGGDSVFWLDEENSHAEGGDVGHESIRPKSMTINVIAKHMINPCKDFAKRGWVSQLLQGAIATYQPTEGFNDLKKEVMAFFWRVIGKSSCGAGSLEMILQSYDSLDLTELIDGDVPLRNVEATNYAGQLGTVALHMILTEYSLNPYDYADDIASRDKVAWLLRHGADPIDKFHRPAEFAALPCFLGNLSARDGWEFSRCYLRRSNSKATDVEVISGVADMMRILGEHGAWELSESDSQHAVRTYANLVQRISYWDRDAGKVMREVVLPSRVSEMLDTMGEK
ncbi:hypothetical protein CGCTS75_v004617 [Colletotrichum tropicale]|nr:hypothetical protein CGCTS75_v004617 [Colletotrichum tropicale]